MNLVILGPQGSGKGTQAKLIAQKYQLVHISAGDLFRQEVASGSDLGKSIQTSTERGELVSDDVLFSILEKAPIQPDQGFILDGTPRNLPQAKVLDQVFGRVGLKIDFCVFIDLPQDESIKRMLLRAQTEHRADDNLASITNRLSIYRKETLPVVEYYRSQGKVIDIDGRPSIQEIFSNIQAKIDSRVK